VPLLEVLRALPWPLLMALGALLGIVASFRRRPDLFERFSFGGPEVTLLALGSVAGWAVNFPLAPLGSSFLALNLGGALLSVFLAALWWRRGVLSPVLAVLGALLVSAVSWFVVDFDPEHGIVSEFPWFFLPATAALGFAFAACRADWPRAVPLAYVSGSVGALLGADIYNLGELRTYFSQANEAVVISVGGAGVFDMVFLSGTVAMAFAVAIAARLVPVEDASASGEMIAYPGRPMEIRDPTATWAAFTRLDAPNPAERATAALALAHTALSDGDFARSVRMSWLAVDSALATGTPALKTRTEGLPEALRRDVAALEVAYREAKASNAAARDVAGNSLTAARYVLGALLPRSGTVNRLVAA